MANVITKETSKDIAKEVFHDWNQIQSKSASDKSEWIEDLMIRLEKKAGKEKAIKIMHECGKKCYDSIAYLQKSAEELRKKKSKFLKEHVENLNKKFTSTSKYELKEKNTIIGEQFKCYCMVKNAKKTFKNKNYC